MLGLVPGCIPCPWLTAPFVEIEDVRGVVVGLESHPPRTTFRICDARAGAGSHSLLRVSVPAVTVEKQLAGVRLKGDLEPALGERRDARAGAGTHSLPLVECAVG